MTLLLHTDGLVERNPRVEREGGLTTLLAALAPRSDAAALVAELEERALGDPPGRLRDDVAVLALQVSGPGR
jgi:hypothetical protein